MQDALRPGAPLHRRGAEGGEARAEAQVQARAKGEVHKGAEEGRKAGLQGPIGEEELQEGAHQGALT